MIYIFDIDGTIADISHRLHFVIPMENGTSVPVVPTTEIPI